MAVKPQYLAFVLEQLEGLGNVSTRRMFSGAGLYRDELFFGLIHDDALFFKTDASNNAAYQARNMPRFMPPVNRPMGPMGYHQVPADIIEEAEALVVWARQAVAVALAASAAKAAKSAKAAKKKSLRRDAPRKPRKAR